MAPKGKGAQWHTISKLGKVMDGFWRAISSVAMPVMVVRLSEIDKFFEA